MTTPGYCVIATVVERATGRAVCLALAEALARFGVPEEIITDNGKQFTDRFGRHGARNGEVLFDKICRKNGITHRLTAPASPNQNGKVERFHGTFRPDFLDIAGPFTSVAAAQAAVDAWVGHYNADRPHQALDEKVPVTPGRPVHPGHRRADAGSGRSVAPGRPWRPQHATDAEPAQPRAAAPWQPVSPAATRAQWHGGPVEFDRVVPAVGEPVGRWAGSSGSGPPGPGQVVRFWADCDLIHLSASAAPGSRPCAPTCRVNDLARLAANGAAPAGPSPLPPIEDGEAVEVDRPVSRGGTGQPRPPPAARRGDPRRAAGRHPDRARHPDVLRPRRPASCSAPDPTRSPPAEVARLRGVRPAGPPPRPSAEPIRVQRRASNTGVIMVAGQKVALGRVHAGQTVTVLVSDTTLAIELDDGDTRVIRRTTTQPVRSIKGQRPRTSRANG